VAQEHNGDQGSQFPPEGLRLNQLKLYNPRNRKATVMAREMRVIIPGSRFLSSRRVVRPGSIRMEFLQGPGHSSGF